MQKIITSKGPAGSPPGIILYMVLFFFLVSFILPGKGEDPFLRCIFWILGWLTWTLGEYLTHRFWMHSQSGKKQRDQLFNHLYHHQHPNEIKITHLHRIFSLCSVLFLLWNGIGGNTYFYALTGFFSGFTLYSFMHYWLHKEWSAKWFPSLHLSHINHHCKFADKYYGVSTTLWDTVFHTHSPVQAVVGERIKLFYFNKKNDTREREKKGFKNCHSSASKLTKKHTFYFPAKLLLRNNFLFGITEVLKIFRWNGNSLRLVMRGKENAYNKFIKINTNCMKKISRWAKLHPWTSRVIIVAIYIGLNIVGIVLGKTLFALNISFPVIILYSSLLALLIGFLSYPSLNEKGVSISRKAFYWKQKTGDAILSIATFLIIVFAGNRYENQVSIFNSQAIGTAALATSIKDSTRKAYKSLAEFSASVKNADGKMLTWKERKKLLRTQLKAIKQSDDLSDGAKVGLTIACVVVAAGLIYLLLALACSLSCSGSEGAAFLVGFGGLAVVIFLLVIAFRAIYKKKGDTKKKKPEVVQPSTTTQ